eukprot:2546878-Ditylum_brightwellii.AAC.1
MKGMRILLPLKFNDRQMIKWRVMIIRMRIFLNSHWSWWEDREEVDSGVGRADNTESTWTGG